MEKLKSFRDLLIWQKSHKLVIEIYKLTDQLPKEEIFGLTSQIRRSAVSIPANIAEGFARTGIKDKLRFYNIAAGSLNELGYYLILIKDLGFVETTELIGKAEEVGRMLSGYVKSVQKVIESKEALPN
jgi:four helix bundle protein